MPAPRNISRLKLRHYQGLDSCLVGVTAILLVWAVALVIFVFAYGE
jgi:hypothetical protein